jgi:DNA recombination protein RmuC
MDQPVLVLLGALVALVFLALVLLVLLWRRGAGPEVAALPAQLADLRGQFDALHRGVERTDLSLREELGRAREHAAQATDRLRDQLHERLAQMADSTAQQQARLAQVQQQQWTAFAQDLRALGGTTEHRLIAVRDTLDTHLTALRADNTKQLEEMRHTVDQKLQATLEERLGASFRQVSDRLEQVHRGLGEMQALASGVGDLKRVLANVKSRGGWGEMNLGGLLEQVLAPEQYATNVAVREGSAEHVEYAVRLPGPEGREGPCVWLPIDAKFPLEDYQRLADAADRGDQVGVEQAGRDLEARLKQCAREISTKYLDPPRTTDFALMYLPTEGLYAETLRRTGLVDTLQRDYRIVPVGPTTLWALLSSLRMGFRTLAIQQRSSEVWTLLGQVKSDFGRFSQALSAVQKKLQEASSKIDEAQKGTRRIERRLQEVQHLPAGEQLLLPAEVPLFESALAGADDEE